MVRFLACCLVLSVVLPSMAQNEVPPAPVAETSGQTAAVQRPPAPAADRSPTDQPGSRQRSQADQAATVFQPGWLKSLTWRSIGPASMGGRIVDIETVASDPYTFYLATASGGLFKTTNNGTTFVALFDGESTVSIGDVAVSRTDPNVIYVGTGEHNPRNSVTWGDGVYKSTDGGKTWRNMGLKKSFQIGRIAIHPTDPDVVYVGALGRLWGPNEERGVYKSINGGETWQRVLYVDDKTGCIDLQMHPRDPDTLLVAMYERQRGRFDVGNPEKRWGPGSGIYKTTNGGNNWKKITQGLPEGELGRIGITYYQTDPNIVYSIVESDMIGDGPAQAYMGIQGSGGGAGAGIRGIIAGGPAQKAGMQDGDTVLEVDGKAMGSYNDVILAIRRNKPADKSRLKVKRGEQTLDLEITWGQRPGTASARPFSSYLGGQRANAMREQGEKGAATGGIYKSTDGGESWTRINSLNPRPFYYSQIRVDPSDDQFIYVLGISFHFSTDGGKVFNTGARRVHSDHHALWINPRDGRHLILGCDGGLYTSYDRGQSWDFHNIMAIGQFYDVGVDVRNPYSVYGGLQDNGSWGAVTRKRGTSGPINADWVRIGGGDGFVCRSDPNDPDLVYYESQYGRMARVNVKTGERASIRPPAQRGSRPRFNWKTPFTLSNHNSKIFYCAGNFVYKSLDRGNNLQQISPEITATDRGSATAIAESPRDPNVLYVGTDDGLLWVTRDGGNQWKNVTDQVGLPGSFQVNSIEPSRFATGRCYVAFDGHRSDNDDPHLYVTEDHGQTWRAIHHNLPTGSTKCLREDVRNANLLYCGTEFAIWASVDRGTSWHKLNNNLPTVAIHEIAVHPIQNEIVAATHGRSLWVLDVTPLRQLSGRLAAAKSHLFAPGDGVKWAGALTSNRSGHKTYAGQNPPFGCRLYYYLADDVQQAALEVRDVTGRVIRRLPASNKAGLHTALWDLRGARRPAGTGGGPTTTPSAVATRATGRGTGPVDPGVYLIRLTADDQQHHQQVRVISDPEVVAGLLQEELELHEAKQRPLFVE